MWTWSLNWNEITPELLVGSCPMRPADLDRISGDTGVTAVLSVQHNSCLAYWGINYRRMRCHGEELGLQMARSPMRDFDVADQRRKLAKAVAALAQLQAQGHRTYVHCTAGLGRAPLTILSYLIWIEGRSREEAAGLIYQGRPGAVPAWEAHNGCREDLVKRYRSRIEKRADALSRTRSSDPHDAEAAWLQAEAEVIRSLILRA